MTNFLHPFSRWILHLFFPRTCACCGRDLSWKRTDYLCDTCAQSLVRPGPLICLRCGVSLPSGGAHCFACRGSKGKAYKCKIIRSAWVFNTPSRALVHGLKYNGADYFASTMGLQMARNFACYPELSSAQLVVPVPLFDSRKRHRGYNQSELLARCFSTYTGLPVAADLLVRSRDTLSQTHLGRKARLENMTDAFICPRPDKVKGKIILLIDDVATTGATLEGCATALRQAGAKRVLAYTYAREN